MTFEAGVNGVGGYFSTNNQVFYSSANNINSTNGTLEFWIKPRWNGNDGRGHFRAIASLALRCTSMFTMGIDFADINRDGLDDFFAVDMLHADHQMRMVKTVSIRPTSRAFSPGPAAPPSHNSL